MVTHHNRERDSTDCLLVEAARRGDKEAFASLLELHQPMLFAVCLRMLRDHDAAEEAAQEAALQAMLSLGDLRQPERFGAWLAGIGLNLCRRMLQQNIRESWSWEVVLGGRLAREPEDQGSSPEKAAEEHELSELVRRAVAALPKGQREAVAMFYLSGLTYAETATALGIDVGAIKTRLHKARRSLGKQLHEVWKEETMSSKAETGAVQARIVDVLATPGDGDATRRHIVLLEEVDGTRRLAIWVGQAEGTAIALQLEQVSAPRPLTFAFLAAVLEAAGGKLRAVRISRLSGDTFYAVAAVEGSRGRVGEIDARPSDALALAMTTGAPILVEPQVFHEAKKWEDTHPEAQRELQAEPGGGAAQIVAEVTSRWPGFGRAS